MPDRVECTVDDTIFRNEENGYTVLTVRAGRERLTCVGSLPPLFAGEQVVMEGEYIEHPQYGRQLKVASCEVLKPSTLLGVERYLASGLIKGVGPATAKLIVKKFGMDTLDILSMYPDRLAEIPKIGAKRAAVIAASYHEQLSARQAMVFLQSYGVPSSLAVKISKIYGDNTQRFVRENPYRLVTDIDGVGFRTADRIAFSLGLAPDSSYRLMAGLSYALSEAGNSSGHTYLPMDELLRQAARLLLQDVEMLIPCLQDAMINKTMIGERTGEGMLVYLPQYYSAETEVARRMRELLNTRVATRGFDERDVRAFETASGINFSPTQRAAVLHGAENSAAIITGGPGTGKTTLIKCLLTLLSRDGDVLLCAPTGRAAKRMTESTGAEAKTIHRLLEYTGEDGAFSKTTDNPLKAVCVIVDETSMVDIFLMRSLLRAIEPGTRLILVGDADQLPSVGAGNVLRDLLDSGAVPSVRLTEIFRQDENSMIVLNAHRINSGEMPELNRPHSDFFFERVAAPSQAAQTIVELCRSRLPKYLGLSDSVRSIQVLAPAKKGDCGVYALNSLLQEALNPYTFGKKQLISGETVLRVGDKVMQTKNDYQLAWKRGGEEGLGVFNGDMGFITDIDTEDRIVTVRFDDDREVIYEDQSREALEIAYCISVHKSQGSEFPVVVLPVTGGPPMLLCRNLFYTALTRAKSFVVLVGREDVIASMVKNDHITQRYSRLAQRLSDTGM
ncbi:MAG: ATP-dependent RecD-like DNA helicase [Eubacteriales bacterium]|nr:ATP-dependent RecD-like DNA helicase [Eubacteriales bacterium]MDD3882867.1 ATP-dependent RecD-like DNA helicase [Eubacteriales bacterium]MDD4512097.1 ATP-dependent RecD-like DNA helicase [Eubacteriales bacterium]